MTKKRRADRRARWDARRPPPPVPPRVDAPVVTRWNGEPADAQRGTAIVADDGRFPEYWARAEGVVGERVPVVRLVYGGHVSWLYDADGSGWAKVTTGGGSPRVGHKNVTIEEGSWTPGS